MIKKLLYAIVIMIGLGFLVGLVVFFIFAPQIPRLPDELRQLASSPPTEVYAADGELLATLGGRSYVSIDRISPDFQNAIIAVEDKRFYDHHGVDMIATARSLFINVIRGGGGPGGSTLTQQMTKNLFFSFKRSWERKILEALAAFAIEERYSKKQILEAYCNLVYFGRYAYGVENASLTYFNKHAADLHVHEAAVLAGLPNQPSRLNPFHNLEGAKIRQKTVLQRMASAGYINPADIDSIWNVPLTLNKQKRKLERGSYPVDYALDLSSDKIGKAATNYGGVKIYTSIDPMLQRMAQQAVKNGVDDLEKQLKPLPEDSDTRLEGALVAIEVATGQVVAMVGGRDYNESTYNRALYAKRHPGSCFKPAVYLTALEQTDILPNTVLVDEEVEIKIDKKRTWSPSNFDNTYMGQVTLKLALMKSINTIAAQLIDSTGPEKVVNTARRLGIKTSLKPLYSLALGAQTMRPYEMANMFSTIARDGVVIEPHVLKRIEGRGGELFYENLETGEVKFEKETVYILIDMLRGVIDGGTGRVIRRLGFRGDALGKTGTSSEYKDAWFCGAVPDLAVAVWVGYDDNRPMRKEKYNVGVVGGVGAAPIWADFIIKATAGEPLRNFQRPDGLRTVFMDPITGELSTDLTDPELLPVTMKEKDVQRIMEADSTLKN